MPSLIKFSQDCMRARSSASRVRNCLEIKRKIGLNVCVLKNFEAKVTNLVSDLFILLSVHPMCGKDICARTPISK